jgi:diketogulonate reductase-like aldo/keto reductase
MMPMFGLGTYQSVNEADMTVLIRSALDAGYRLIDTAWVYKNEKFIGNSLKTIFSEGKYSRKDVFIATKVVPYKG